MRNNMAKKVSKVFKADLTKNNVKGGAWMATVSVQDEGIDTVDVLLDSAWANASAGKRWIKEKVQELTPRKSVKMVAGADLDAKNKPLFFRGELVFKA
jgi:hypothetical protein